MRTRRLGYVTAPPSPDQSTEIRLLTAMIQSAATERWGLWLSAIAREEARVAGSLFAPLLLVNAPPDVRAAIAQTNGLDLVLGWWELPLEFHPGLAALTEQECRAWGLKVGGFDEREIATYMDGKRRRTKQFGVSLETVHSHIEHGRRKLMHCFSGLVLEAA